LGGVAFFEFEIGSFCLIEENFMAAQAYLNSTEPAVQHLFEGLNSYDTMKLPSIQQYVDKTGLVKMTKEENESFLKSYQDFFALEFARATLAGSILQVAYLGLKQNSPGPDDAAACAKFSIQSGSAVERFCRGRQVHGIPIGLLIYAGRVQYNHWEDGEPSGTVAKSVFQELIWAYYDNLSFDMAYELNYPSARPVSHYIVRLELNWRSYDDYLTDMKTLLEIR
jgi:hypothetical protein